MERGSVTPPFGGAPVQFVDVFPLTPDGKVHLFPDELDAQAPGGSLRLSGPIRRPTAIRSR